MPPRAGRKTMVEVRQVTKRYQAQGRRQAGGAATQALDGVSFAVAEGEFVGIMGPSGSGKSTLLNCLATIDVPTSGSIAIGGMDITRLAGKQLARFRRDDLGFIFQDSNLLDTLTAFENIALALTIQKAPVREIDARVNAAARQLGIHEVLDSYPYQLSGGQRQRVAAARATITHPKLVLADEPTGALDSRATDELLRLFEDVNRGGQTILMVTHSVKAASHASRVLFIKDGEVFHEIYRGESSDEQLYQKISDTLTMLATGGEHHA